MDGFDLWFGRIANGLTILAAVIAIAGVIWAVLSRARLGVRSMRSPSLVPSLTLIVTSDGSNPIRNLELIAGTLTPSGFSMAGGDIATLSELGGGETLLVEAFDPRQTTYADPPRPNERRWEITGDEGFYLQARWQHPLLPWRRASRTYAWTTPRRFGDDDPEVLHGRAERAFLKQTQDPALNPTLASYIAPRRAGATVATDETFDAIVSAYNGVTIVGFGPTWQGEHWLATRRVLDVFATRHSKRIQVLVVNVDEAPVLSSRFETNIVPTFKALLDGKVVAEHNGIVAYSDLEEAFSSYLR